MTEAEWRRTFEHVKHPHKPDQDGNCLDCGQAVLRRETKHPCPTCLGTSGLNMSQGDAKDCGTCSGTGIVLASNIIPKQE